jgi:hypothetical protein
MQTDNEFEKANQKIMDDVGLLPAACEHWAQASFDGLTIVELASIGMRLG